MNAVLTRWERDLLYMEVAQSRSAPLEPTWADEAIAHANKTGSTHGDLYRREDRPEDRRPGWFRWLRSG